jgi:hypothetical protein
MLIEAAKGGHTAVVQLLLDYPHNVMIQPGHPQAIAAAAAAAAASGQQPTTSGALAIPTPSAAPTTSTVVSAVPPALHQVPEAVRATDPPVTPAQQDHHQVAAPAPVATSQPAGSTAKTAATPQPGTLLLLLFLMLSNLFLHKTSKL